MSPTRSFEAGPDHRTEPANDLHATPDPARVSLTVQLAERQPFGLIVTPDRRQPSSADIPMHLARAWVRRYRVVILRGFSGALMDEQALAQRAVLWSGADKPGPIRIERITPDTRLRTMHWIGDNPTQAPEFLLFHCHVAPTGSQRGCTRFVDAAALAGQLDEQTFERWRRLELSTTPHRAVHDGDGGSWPLLARDPRDAAPVLRYRWLDPTRDGQLCEPWLLGDDPDNTEQARRLLHGILRLPIHHFVHAWQEGDLVIADNWRLLHAHDTWRRDLPGLLLRASVGQRAQGYYSSA